MVRRLLPCCPGSITVIISDGATKPPAVNSRIETTGCFMINWWKTWLAARKQTERYLFRVLERSVRTGDSKTILRNLMRWLDSIEQSERPARLDSFLTRYCEPPEREIIMRLQKAAMRDEHPFPERKPLLHALGHARKCRRKERREITRASATLPLLNPDKNRKG